MTGTTLGKECYRGDKKEQGIEITPLSLAANLLILDRKDFR